LLRRHDPRGVAAAIGPSGENLGRMAAIVHGTGFASGISGFGAVMGSKKLKAFGVRGSGGVAVADPGRLLQLVERTVPLIYDPDDPPRMTGMRRLGSDYPGGEEFVRRHSVGLLACHACPSACQGVFDVPGTPLGADCCVWPHSMAVGFTEGPDGWKAAWEVNSLVNRLGLSMYEVHQSFQFVRDLHAAGLLEAEEAGLPLDGDPRDLVKELADQIAHRRGLGALLAEQLPRAAQKMGVDLDRFVTEVRGWPILMPWDDPRLHALRALQPAAGGHFPHNEGWMFWSVFRGAYNVPAHRADAFLDDDEVHAVARQLLGEETAADGDDLRGKAEMLLLGTDYRTLADALGFCCWVMPADCSYYDAELRGDQSALAAFFSALTGVETSVPALARAGARIHALERLQGVRWGYYSREADRRALQRKLFSEPSDESPLPGGVIDERLLGAELDRYYELRGWDPDTGAPTAGTLEALGAADLLPFLPS
jgi:aldehyde:ferredoxin oxidoreductase